MKFSIVTASFNQGRFINKCLSSVILQTGKNTVEHIILDNCSTDSTVEALATYQDKPGAVDVLIHVEKDKGQTAAINKGFSLATGDVVCWLNTDEWYEKNTLEQVADFFEEHPDVDVVFGNCDFVDENGKLVKRKREFFYSESMLVFYGCYIPSCSTFIRRRVIDAGLLLLPEFKVTMDFDWYVRIAKAGYRFAHMPATLASFTWHDTNISSTFVDRRRLERRLIQDRHSGISGPAWFRTVYFETMRYLWIAVRITRRLGA